MNQLVLLCSTIHDLCTTLKNEKLGREQLIHTVHLAAIGLRFGKIAAYP